MEKAKQKAKELKQKEEASRQFLNYFIKESQERGKTISILLPLIKQEDITDLVAELYDYRTAVKEEEKNNDNKSKN